MYNEQDMNHILKNLSIDIDINFFYKFEISLRYK